MKGGTLKMREEMQRTGFGCKTNAVWISISY